MRTLWILLLLTLTLWGRTQWHMGTWASITLPNDAPPSLYREAFEAIAAVEHSLSDFAPDATIARLNRDGFVALDSLTYEALRLSWGYYVQTQGYFNIAIGALTQKAYRFGRDARIPSQAQLQHANTSLYALRFHRAYARLYDGIQLDFGGMGKGFGVDKAVEMLQKADIVEGIIALSGDMRCLDRCTVGIAHPWEEDKIWGTFTTSQPNMAISTSGTYRRYAQTPVHHHLIAPHKAPQRTFASVTLVAQLPNATLDAYATAVSTMPRAKALLWLAKHPAIDYYLITQEGQIEATLRLDSPATL